MIPTLALLTLLAPLARAIPCVQFDAQWNLYAFGGNQDVNLGQSSSWGSPNPQTLTSTGRPPWTGNNTQCLLSQYNNAMYVIGGDSSDASLVYIYNFAGNSWSTQSTSSAPPNLGNSRSASVLDHDTNVLFTLPSGSDSTLYQLDMSSVTNAASGSALSWETVTAPSFGRDNYSPVAAHASNHIHYFGVPGTAAGSANVFVVHYATFQPAAQAYPTLNGGSAFPDAEGQAITIPQVDNNAPLQMAYIPNDFSSTYIVSHWTDPSDYSITSGAPFAQNLINSTQALPAPSSRDASASYAASNNALAQIDSNGDIYYVSSAINSDYTIASGASWTKLGYSLAGVSGGSSSSASASASAGPSASGSASVSGSASRSAGASATSARPSGSSSSGAAASPTGAASATLSLGRWDLMGLAAGLMVVGGALVL